MDPTDHTEQFEAERPRLTRLASRMLADPVEAQDVVQQAWLRLAGTDSPVDDLPAWLTTVTTRLCLDRLKARVPEPADAVDDAAPEPGPADEALLGDSVVDALGVVLDRLTPIERVAFVMHDSFGFDFPVIAAALDLTPAAARQSASRARRKVRQPEPDSGAADHEVVDAFMTAARGGEFDRLLSLLAPDARVRADAGAIATGTPERIDGSRAIAEFFNGSAHAALPATVDGRPVFAWFHRGRPMVVFDFDVAGGTVRSITFRADAELLARVTHRRADSSTE
ncbi:sigma-70 family RNA polymerase sigma factor [Gordonia sp. (in: high G+C Gram-positive bacteria)]|uniref:sigma-70 family RNA polymerase sigma factor n=1 Tax=Gordonia sp. (in: high G+C Gram-positive bacteria) TaxID=84139 RepID=UPI0039E2A81B